MEAVGLFDVMKVKMPKQPYDIRQDIKQEKLADGLASVNNHYFSTRKERMQWIEYRLDTFGWYIDKNNLKISLG